LPTSHSRFIWKDFLVLHFPEDLVDFPDPTYSQLRGDQLRALYPCDMNIQHRLEKDSEAM